MTTAPLPVRRGGAVAKLGRPPAATGGAAARGGVGVQDEKAIVSAVGSAFCGGTHRWLYPNRQAQRQPHAGPAGICADASLSAAETGRQAREPRTILSPAYAVEMDNTGKRKNRT